MANFIGVVGPSGSGKTTGLRNLPPAETVIVKPNSKRLPWPGAMVNFKTLNKKEKTGNVITTNDMTKLPLIVKHINEERPDIKYLIFDDFTHFFNARTQSDAFRSKNSGSAAFKKWADLGADAYKSLFENELEMRDDLFIIHHYHIEEGEDISGTMVQKLKTPGKLLDREIDVPSYYTYLLYTKVETIKKEPDNTKRFKYVVKHDGVRPAKTPLGCFDDEEIPNDIVPVIKQITKYENGETELTDEQKQAA